MFAIPKGLTPQVESFLKQARTAALDGNHSADEVAGLVESFGKLSGAEQEQLNAVLALVRDGTGVFEKKPLAAFLEVVGNATSQQLNAMALGKDTLDLKDVQRAAQIVGADGVVDGNERLSLRTLMIATKMTPQAEASLDRLSTTGTLAVEKRAIGREEIPALRGALNERARKGSLTLEGSMVHIGGGVGIDAVDPSGGKHMLVTSPAGEAFEVHPDFVSLYTALHEKADYNALYAVLGRPLGEANVDAGGKQVQQFEGGRLILDRAGSGVVTIDPPEAFDIDRKNLERTPHVSLDEPAMYDVLNGYFAELKSGEDPRGITKTDMEAALLNPELDQVLRSAIRKFLNEDQYLFSRVDGVSGSYDGILSPDDLKAKLVPVSTTMDEDTVLYGLRNAFWELTRGKPFGEETAFTKDDLQKLVGDLKVARWEREAAATALANPQILDRIDLTVDEQREGIYRWRDIEAVTTAAAPATVEAKAAAETLLKNFHLLDGLFGADLDGKIEKLTLQVVARNPNYSDELRSAAQTLLFAPGTVKGFEASGVLDLRRLAATVQPLRNNLPERLVKATLDAQHITFATKKRLSDLAGDIEQPTALREVAQTLLAHDDMRERLLPTPAWLVTSEWNASGVDVYESLRKLFAEVTTTTADINTLLDVASPLQSYDKYLFNFWAEIGRPASPEITAFVQQKADEFRPSLDLWQQVDLSVDRNVPLTPRSMAALQEYATRALKLPVTVTLEGAAAVLREPGKPERMAGSNEEILAMLFTQALRGAGRDVSVEREGGQYKITEAGTKSVESSWWTVIGRFGLPWN